MIIKVIVEEEALLEAGFAHPFNFFEKFTDDFVSYAIGECGINVLHAGVILEHMNDKYWPL